MVLPASQHTLEMAVRLHQADRLPEAEQIYRHILQRQPKHAIALCNLGNLLRESGRFDEAIASCREAIVAKPDFAEAYNVLGSAQHSKSELDDAIASYRRAITLKPDFAECFNNLSLVYVESGDVDQAIAVARQAIAIKPTYAKAYNSLGFALHNSGQFDAAIDAYRHSIALDGKLASAHNNLAMSYLLQGNFADGWEEYEWRWKCKEYSTAANFAKPRWDGQPLRGRTILLYAEQGYGDALQFIRYWPLVAERDAKIVISCRASLKRLFETNISGCQIISWDEPLPPFEVYCPLLSLPRIFATIQANIPAPAAYLHADPEDVQRWQHRLAEIPAQIKIGLVWRGSSLHKNDRNRSIPSEKLAPLAGIAGIQFISLQKADGATKDAKPPPIPLIDWTQELSDFSDTAALIANLDLIIGVDTSVAHLAGALGKPMWTLLPFVPDWRWMLKRTDSPWYPSMQLFRQPSPNDWDTVINGLTASLEKWVYAVKQLPASAGRGSS